MLDWKPEIRRRLARLQLAPTRENAIVEELAQHLDESYAELLASGVSEADAYRQLRAELYDGGLLTHGLRRVERSTNPEPVTLGTTRRTNMIADLWQDLRFGVRMLLKHPGFTLIAALTLALGIGANTAIFSVCNAVLFKPLPYAEPSRIVTLSERQRDGTLGDVAPANFVDWRDANRSFSGMAAVRASSFAPSFILGGQSEASRLTGAEVSSSFFSVLGVRFMLGRNFLPEEDRPGQDR